MRVAVISDIHGNFVALDAVLEDLREHPADTVVCLGDAIQGGPQPSETVARLREHEFAQRRTCPVVMGNADAWLLTGVDTAEESTEVQRQVREWSLSKLSQGDVAYIESFQPTIEIALEGGNRLLCFHGSPTSFDDVILPETPEDEFQRLLGDYAGYITTGGHTHLQQIRRLGDCFFFNPGSVGMASSAIGPATNPAFNPGSVGVGFNRHQPEDTLRMDPWAEYAVLTSEGSRLALELRRVPYDVARFLRIYEESDKPHREASMEQYKRGLEDRKPLIELTK